MVRFSCKWSESDPGVEDPVGTAYISSFYFSVPPFFCQRWSNQNKPAIQIYLQQDGYLNPLCPQLWLQSSPIRSCNLTHVELALHWSKRVVGCLCTVLIFGIRNLLCWDPSLSVVWFQLIYLFELLLMLLFHHLQFSINSAWLSLMKSDLFINLKGRVPSKSAYDTTCELQELELQLIKRDTGTVTWADLYLRHILWGHKSPWKKSLVRGDR